MKTLFLHSGGTKTGSSAFQNFLALDAEALRASGGMELRPASREYCTAWAVAGRSVEWKIYDGVAVTLDEFEHLTSVGSKAK